MTRLTLTHEDEARFRLQVAFAEHPHAAIARRFAAEIDALRATLDEGKEEASGDA